MYLQEERVKESAKDEGFEACDSTRLAGARDIIAITRVVNSAFAIETFLEGARTDEVRMREMIEEGDFLVAQDESGRVVACVYTELRGERGYFGMLAVDPSRQGKGRGRMMVAAAENHSQQRVVARWTPASSVCARNSRRFIASWAMSRASPRSFTRRAH